MGNLKRQLFFLFLLFIASFLVTTVLFWFSEQYRADITSYWDVAWWWLVTSTTVGYGDVVPETITGRLAGVISIIIGIFGYTYTISLILQRVQLILEYRERGKGVFKGSGHVLICEYTAFADELIQTIRRKGLFKDRKLVIVTALVDRQPYADCEFIYGVPISPEVLARANVSKASRVFVFSNSRYHQPDAKTLHIVSRIMRYNTEAPVYV